MHKAYRPEFKGKKIGLITVCGDSNVSTADPIVHSFKNTSDFAGLIWVGVVKASASSKGEISRNEAVKKRAHDLGRKAAAS